VRHAEGQEAQVGAGPVCGASSRLGGGSTAPRLTMTQK